MASKSTPGVIRHERRLVRYYPFTSGSSSAVKEEMKKEVIQLGVKLSLSSLNPCSYFVMISVLCYIKPKKRVFKNYGQYAQWRLISTTWEDFANGVMVMFSLVRVLRRKDWSYDNHDRLLFSAIEKFKQVLKRLDDKLRSKKNDWEKNGFMRETIEPNIYELWKSIFDEKAKETTHTLKEIRNRIISCIFDPIAGKPIHRKIRAMPPHTPYMFGSNDFPKQELKEEVVKLGIERLLYVNYAIQPKDKAFENDDARWVQWKVIRTTMKDFAAGIRDLDRLVTILRGEGSYSDDREFTSRIEALKRIDDKLRCTKKNSEENGFAREMMESNILELWRFLFDKKAKGAWKPRVMRRIVSLTDLYKPLLERTL
ncbi:hypothetical protein Bca4012_051977 [Brassica carinata]